MSGYSELEVVIAIVAKGVVFFGKMDYTRSKLNC
jgi:hypothetical protein